MWEAYDMKDENFLWAAIPFMGGISGENLATCGAVSGMAVSLGLRHRCSLANKEAAKAARAKARNLAGKLVKEFTEKFGHVTCQELLGIDFSKPGAYQQFRGSGVAGHKCYEYVYFVIEKLYEFENED
jgi:C_GCAxxG_C_C family probable redox protein